MAPRHAPVITKRIARQRTTGPELSGVVEIELVATLKAKRSKVAISTPNDSPSAAKKFDVWVWFEFDT